MTMVLPRAGRYRTVLLGTFAALVDRTRHAGCL
jgi:hypothetical protein